MRCIIITDSRGTGLHRHLAEMNSRDEIKVIIHKGAGYELAVIKSLNVIKSTRPDLIIIMAGICDLTWRDKITKITSIRYKNPEETVQHVIDAAKAAYDLLKATNDYKISFATLTGIDLADYNHPPRKNMTSDEYKNYTINQKQPHEDQNTVNKAIIEINRQLTSINQANGIPTAWLAGVVHNYFRGKYHHYYVKLADGCHADERTKIEWAKRITKTLIRSMPMIKN